MAENGGFDVTGLILGPDEMERFLTALWSEPGAPAVYAEGPPGQGKSDIFRQVARNLKAEYHERILVTMEPSDITGIPALDTENALFKYCPDALFEKCSTKYPDGGPVVIMLDDLATAPPQLQAAAFALVLNRRAGPHILRDNVFIGAAGNREEDNAGANELLTALAKQAPFGGRLHP
jgi:MoxR-like ATPase